MFAALDRGRREALICSIVAVALVLIRSAAFTFSEGLYFDSDQAIVGLMAKHLSEFRTFPLFFYGQNYQLGIQAWLIAPFFWIARPSVLAMRVPLSLIGAVAAVVLVRTLRTSLNLRPALALVAALPFLLPMPVVAGSLLITDGSGALLFLYVLFLWLLRERPFAFGALLALGFLHREFTLYALPALLIVEVARGSAVFTVPAAKRVAQGAAGFALVWLIVDIAKIEMTGASASLQVQMMGANTCLPTGDLTDRIRYVLTACVPLLTGGRVTPLDNFAMRSSVVVGSRIVGWMVCLALGLMLIRLLMSWNLRRGGPDISYGAYLALVGTFTLAAYPLSCGALASDEPVVRYLHLALLLPIGLFSMFIVREPSRFVRGAGIAVFLVWGTATLVDNVRVLYAASTSPNPDPHRELADFLLSHHIRYAHAGYWDAYIVDFLTRERVIVGADGSVRIPEYEQRVRQQGANAATIIRMPCTGDALVADWCISLPGR